MKNLIYYNSVAAHPHHQMGNATKTIHTMAFQSIRRKLYNRINKKIKNRVRS